MSGARCNEICADANNSSTKKPVVVCTNLGMGASSSGIGQGASIASSKIPAASSLEIHGDTDEFPFILMPPTRRERKDESADTCKRRLPSWTFRPRKAPRLSSDRDLLSSLFLSSEKAVDYHDISTSLVDPAGSNCGNCPSLQREIPQALQKLRFAQDSYSTPPVSLSGIEGTISTAPRLQSRADDSIIKPEIDLPLLPELPAQARREGLPTAFSIQLSQRATTHKSDTFRLRF